MASRSLDDCDQSLALAWPAIVSQYESLYPGRTAIITCTHRSVEEQKELYCNGRTKPGPVVTNCDGVSTLSKHNSLPAKALDFAILVNGKITWEEFEYVRLGKIAADMGFTWGGNWTHFKDYPHIELKGGV